MERKPIKKLIDMTDENIEVIAFFHEDGKDIWSVSFNSVVLHLTDEQKKRLCGDDE